MAIVELDGGRADRAIQQLRASYAVAKRGKDVPAMAQDAILIGNVQLEARRPDQAAKQYQEADLILPEGGRIHFVRTSAGQGFDTAVFVHQETPALSATPT